MPDRLGVDDIVDVLKRTDFFGSATGAALRQLAAVCGQRHVERGQHLWWEGDPGDRLVVVGAGLLKLVVSSERGEDLVLGLVGRNELVGEVSLLDGGSRLATVIALEKSLVITIPRATVLEVVTQDPQVLESVLHALGRLVRRSNERAADQVFLDLNGRLAKALLAVAEERPTRDAGSVDVRLNQSDLAAMVGATRSAVNRALHALAARDLIRMNGASIEVRDVTALRRRAQGST